MTDSDVAKAIPCEEHRWFSIHQPDLPVYWIEQCSECHSFNAKRMVEELKAAGWTPGLPVKDAHIKPAVTVTGRWLEPDGMVRSRPRRSIN
jgi:hypothetical protein